MAGRFLEAAGAIGLVLAFFLVCLVVLFVAIPKGIGLGRLVRYERIAAESRSGVTLGEEGWQSVLGLVSRVRRTVRSRTSASVVWTPAAEGLELGDGDAVQTHSRSGAVISLGESGEMRVGENSMVVLRKVEENEEAGATRASVVLARGEMEGRVEGGRSSVEVVAGSATARIRPGRGADAEFRVTTNPEDVSTFAVYEGRGEVTAGGRTVVLAADQAVTVDEAGNFGSLVSLPPTPAPDSPPDGAVLTSRTLPAEVPFSWGGLEEATGYRLVVSHDPLLVDPAFDRKLVGAGFVHGNLRPGPYYWSVSTLNGEVEGRASAVRSFRVEHDGVSPALAVDLPEGTVHQDVLVVRGETEPGARVFIGDEVAKVEESGRFEGRVPLRPGPNIVVVEAMDAAGNVSYRSSVVLAVP